MDIHSVARTYARADNRRAWWELGSSLVLYFAALITALSFIGTWWIMVPALLVNSAMGARLYMIQHDCLHRAFFTDRSLNDRVGTLISPLAMTPYHMTRHVHSQHHTYVSDLDRRESFEIYVKTLDEWHQTPPLRRLGYRIFRSPFVLILTGPFLLYGIGRRFPIYGLKHGLGDLMLHNALLGAYLYAIWLYAGWPGLGVWCASFYIAVSFGALIPYVVHNFEYVHWGTKPELDFQTAALKGSAVLDWGRLFNYITMNIAYHDLHHFNAKIPGYKIAEAHRDLEARGLISSTRIGFIDGLRCLRWKLYDEAQGKMVPFPRKSRAPRLQPAE